MTVLREKLLLRDPTLLEPLGEVEPSSFMDVKCENLGPSESFLHKRTVTAMILGPRLDLWLSGLLPMSHRKLLRCLDGLADVGHLH